MRVRVAGVEQRGPPAGCSATQRRDRGCTNTCRRGLATCCSRPPPPHLPVHDIIVRVHQRVLVLVEGREVLAQGGRAVGGASANCAVRRDCLAAPVLAARPSGGPAAMSVQLLDRGCAAACGAACMAEGCRPRRWLRPAADSDACRLLHCCCILTAAAAASPCQTSRSPSCHPCRWCAPGRG